MNKVIKLLIATVLFFGIFSFTAKLNASAAVSGIFTYTVTNNTVTITDCDETQAQGFVEIPSTIAGFPVTKIATGACKGCIHLTSICIPDSVTTIGDEAFSGCAFQEIAIPDSVRLIGFGVLSNCNNLTSVTIPFLGSSVTSDSNFGYLFGSLPYVTQNDFLPESLQTVILTDECQTVWDNAFLNCSNIKTVFIGNNATSIGNSAFSGCTTLETVSIGNQVMNLGVSAFSGCTALKTVLNVSGVQDIGYCAFTSCINLSSLDSFSSAVNIGSYAFEGCISLTSCSFGDSLRYIGACAFAECTSLTSFNDGENLTEIRQSAFLDCSALTSMTLAFIGNTPTDNTFLGYLFGGNSYYENEGCVPASLNTLTLATGTNNLNALYGCRGIETINLLPSVTSINPRIFDSCSNLSAINADSANSNFTSDDGVLYNKSKTELMQYPSGKANLYFLVPTGVTVIDSSAFKNNKALLSVTLPDSVTSVGFSAFVGCTHLDTMTLPFVGGSKTNNTHLGYLFGASNYSNNASYVPLSLHTILLSDACTTLGNSALYGLSGITSIAFGKGVSLLGESAFSGCSGLTTINVNAENTVFESLNGVLFLKSKSNIVLYPQGKAGAYSIPDSVTTIGRNAFSNCTKLSSIVIPESVTTIESGAFYNCRLLASISLPGNLISIGESAFQYCVGLTSVVVPDKITEIKDYIFSGCTRIVSVSIPDHVTRIGASAFSYCNMQTISIPTTVTELGNNAFAYCYSLTSVVVPEGVTKIGQLSFFQCNKLTVVSLPSTVTEIGSYPFQNCGALSAITVDDANPYFSSVNGVLFNHEKSVLLAYPGGNVQSTYVIPDGVTTIGFYSFTACGNLTTVLLPKSLMTLENYAFYDCPLLTKAKFAGNLPNNAPEYPFISMNANFTIYYLDTAEGWSTPTYHEYPCFQLFSILYDSNASTDPVTNMPQDNEFVSSGESFELPATLLARTGFLFKGWSFTPTGEIITGNTITISDASITLYAIWERASTEIGLLGDADMDGDITAYDAVVILQIIAGTLTASDAQSILCNINRDVSGTTAYDAVLLLGYVAGLDSVDPIGEMQYQS